MARLSVFVISYNRHYELKKKINFFYKNFHKEIKIFVIDGSLKKLQLNRKKLINKNINYIHYPTEDYHLRLNYLSNLIKTPYTQIQNDDDYFDQRTLLKCCNLLEKNKKKGYVSCYGNSGIYSKYKSQIYIKQLFNLDKKKLNSSNNRYIRLKSYFIDNPYSPAIYFSVTQKKVLKNIISIFKRSRKYYGEDIQLFAENLITSTVLMSGKSIYVDDIFWLRNDSDIKKRVEFKKIKKLIKNTHVYTAVTQYLYERHVKKNYLNNFFSNIFVYLKIPDSEEYFLKKISKIFLQFYMIGFHQKNKFSLKKKIISIISLILPSCIKKYIRFNFGINGPSINEICTGKKKVNFKFRKAFLYEIEKYFINYS